MSSSLLLHASVQYRALAEKASDVIKATVPKLNLDDAFEQKNGIAKAVEDELEKAISTYGYEMVLVTQYFDTVKKIGASSKSSSVFIPHGPGAVRDVAAQIRGLLQGSTH